MRDYLVAVWREEWPEKIGDIWFIFMTLTTIAGAAIGLAAVLGLV